MNHTEEPQIFKECCDTALTGGRRLGGVNGGHELSTGKNSQLIIFHESVGENKMKIPFMVECLREQLSIVLTHGR